MSSVVIIGSGNVAQALASAIKTSNHTLKQIFARNISRGKEVAKIGGCAYASRIEELATADIYIISVQDSAVAEVSQTIAKSSVLQNDSIVAHTAGSLGVDRIDPSIKNRGVFYPLQTFSSGRDVDFSAIPIFVEGTNIQTLKALESLAKEVTNNVFKVELEQRQALHLAAVFACNFTNNMYATAQQILAQNGLPATILNPLITETAAKAIKNPSAVDIQTGPAIRGDIQTQQHHLEQLKNSPRLQALYKLISQNIWEISKKI